MHVHARAPWVHCVYLYVSFLVCDVACVRLYTYIHFNQVCRSVVHIVELGVIPTAVSQVLRSLSVKAKAIQD